MRQCPSLLLHYDCMSCYSTGVSANVLSASCWIVWTILAGANSFIDQDFMLTSAFLHRCRWQEEQKEEGQDLKAALSTDNLCRFHRQMARNPCDLSTLLALHMTDSSEQLRHKCDVCVKLWSVSVQHAHLFRPLI